MKTVYEALRELLRSKELEVKRLEKEMEALRIVLPIVAEAGEPKGENANGSKPQGYSASDLNAVFAESMTAAGPAPERQSADKPKSQTPRSNWP